MRESRSSCARDRLFSSLSPAKSTALLMSILTSPTVTSVQGLSVRGAQVYLAVPEPDERTQCEFWPGPRRIHALKPGHLRPMTPTVVETGAGSALVFSQAQSVSESAVKTCLWTRHSGARFHARSWTKLSKRRPVNGLAPVFLG